jgi:hypothetical protein
MDGYFSAALLARIATFAEVIFPGAESTPVVRGSDDQFDHFTCSIFTHRFQYELVSAGGIVQLCAQSLDSAAPESTLIVEVEAADEHALDTLRTCLCAIEMVAALRKQKDVGGLHVLQRLIAEALGVPVVVRRI